MKKFKPIFEPMKGTPQNKAFELGSQACKNGDSFKSNPMVYGPNKSLAAYWDSGWITENEKTLKGK